MGEMVVLDSEKLAGLLLDLRIDKTGLSKRAGLSYQTIRSIMMGGKRIRPLNALKIADALGVQVEDLKA